MENIIYEDSPLAAYLEGEGKVDPSSEQETSDPSSPIVPSFAPRGPSTLQARIRDKLPRPLQIPISNRDPVGRLQQACSRMVKSTGLAQADNERFLEHFRYVIIASQLLSEYTGPKTLRVPGGPTGVEGASHIAEFKVASISWVGAAVTGFAAFSVVWLLHWSRGGAQIGFKRGRIMVTLGAVSLIAIMSYAYIRRQWLQFLRQEAVNTASTLSTNLQAFDASSTAALTLIQEVELVSRGYRLSSPLPPISRLEDRGQARRCARLRRMLKGALSALLPPFAEKVSALRQLVDENDLEKYLDIYDVSNPDVQEAARGWAEDEFEDPESLRALRILQFRLSTLRRVFLCSLLALEADGGKSDYVRWRIAVEAMEQLASMTGRWSEKINSILSEEEQFTVPASPLRGNLNTPARERLRAQIRKISSLSQGIRGLQAKMQILREESNRSLEDSEDVSELGASLMAQYESIGADLRGLVQAWESGKAALALNIDRQERRVSQASSSTGLRSPVPSLGGLTAVDEGGGGPSDALRALTGAAGYASDALSGHSSDEEVFEAIALPRQRAPLSREERVLKIAEDRVRQQAAREQREVTDDMLKELQSVIHLRPKRNPAGRITSI